MTALSDIARPLLRAPRRGLEALRPWSVVPREGDQYIASFPRSGSTWLRTVITNVLDPSAQSDPEVFNARIPGVSFRNLPTIYRLPSPRLLKTHAAWWPGARRAVYLVRDGADAISSFYHYVSTRAGRQMSFEAFYERYARGDFGPPWHAHVEGWLGPGRRALGENLLVVRFEDLKADTPGVVASVLDFLGLPAGSAQIGAAIEAASIENMRRIEAQEWGGARKGDVSFYRGGRSGQAEDLFPADLRAHFQAVSADARRVAGYPPRG